jgi:two-component system phosphate regulon response regulator PhoB
MSANIIIVEDEKDLATLLKYNLSKEGFKIKEAETGQEGLQLIKRELPDLVILDWMLPDFSGIEVCRQIKRDNKLKSIPVIMLTAKSEIEDKVRGLEMGVDDYITKPFNNKELILRV